MSMDFAGKSTILSYFACSTFFLVISILTYSFLDFIHTPYFFELLGPFRGVGVDIECPGPLVANSAETCGIAFSYSHPQCWVKCEPGYRLVTNTLKCNQEGVYEGNAFCEPIKCEPPFVPGALSVCPEGISSKPGSKCNVECPNGALEDNTLMCHISGTVLGTAKCKNHPRSTTPSIPMQQINLPKRYAPVKSENPANEECFITHKGYALGDLHLHSFEHSTLGWMYAQHAYECPHACRATYGCEGFTFNVTHCILHDIRGTQTQTYIPTLVESLKKDDLASGSNSEEEDNTLLGNNFLNLYSPKINSVNDISVLMYAYQSENNKKALFNRSFSNYIKNHLYPNTDLSHTMDNIVSGVKKQNCKPDIVAREDSVNCYYKKEDVSITPDISIGSLKVTAFDECGATCHAIADCGGYTYLSYKNICLYKSTYDSQYGKMINKLHSNSAIRTESCKQVTNFYQRNIVIDENNPILTSDKLEALSPTMPHVAVNIPYDDINLDDRY